MNNLSHSNFSFEKVPLQKFAEEAYLNYSMYVILDRALPHIADGLKPVQRRIIYAMSELGLKNSAKFKKSARTVGDVLGKYHPHGDSACYEAMVLMAQNFSYRYPLVDGQGNWGSTDDPKSFAAMRYTEARLSKYADLLLKELEKGTTTWIPNFDGTLNEPKLLPARLPNILLNGSSGIAVGMATDIPSHNLREVVQACIALLDNEKLTLEEITEFLPGPDLATAAEIITPKEELRELYRTGSGSFRQRSVYVMDDNNIIITALPYQVSGAKVLEQIAEQMQAKKLPMIEDLRDESDHENPTRLVIVPRSNRVDIGTLMAHLFATTDLEKSYRVNLNMIGLDGRPQVKNIKMILQEWLQYRTEVVRKRLTHRLQKVNERLHILDGLLIAFLNIDEVIHIIRYEDDPKQCLMQRFSLSEQQVEAILDMKLRHLAKLEEIQIRTEQDELSKERKQLEAILSKESLLKKLIKEELEEDAENFGDPRQSPIVARRSATAIREEEIIPNEPVTIVLSKMGWIRAAKGHEIDPDALNFKTGDSLLQAACGRSNQQVILLDSTGRSYSLSAHQLPSARGQGEPLTGRFNPPPGANFVAVLTGDLQQHVLLATDAGYGFICTLEDLICKNKAGKAVISVPSQGKLLPPCFIQDLEQDKLMAISASGHCLVFPVKDLPIQPRGKGNKIINIASSAYQTGQDYMQAITVLKTGQTIILISGKKDFTLKPQDLANFVGERARKGNKLPRGLQKVDGFK